VRVQEYWDKIGVNKNFEDPLYIDKFAPFLLPNSQIIEYGCGYGRMMNILKSKGYKNLIGFDFAKSMIARGKKENPDLDLRLIEKSGVISCDNESIDAILMSTVLCCLTEAEERKLLVEEILRILKQNGILYITDFLLCEHFSYEEKYTQGMREFGKWGIYRTNEGLVVCHYSSQEILNLLSPFDIQWFEQYDFKTMNQNPARTFHCIAKKNKTGFPKIE
jgi:ubiquinone/menaquinone biosynthesis C-methylase UbiE